MNRPARPTESSYNRLRDIEGIFWTVLAFLPLVYSQSRWNSIYSFVTLSGVVAELVRPHTADKGEAVATRSMWRLPGNGSTNSVSGRSMAYVLLPLLLQTMDGFSADRETDCGRFGMLIIVGNFVGLAPSVSNLGIAAALMVASDLPVGSSIGFLVTWLVLALTISYVPSLHGVLTQGEWTLITALTTIAIAVFGTWETSDILEENMHHYMALSGVLACGCGCVTVARWPYCKRPVVIQLAALASIPLIGIELAISNVSNLEVRKFPKLIYWLLAFLRDTEAPTTGVITTKTDPWGLLTETRPRFHWLLYWAVVLAVTLPLAPVSDRISPVITRKWFHVVAILLFAPVTIAAPELLSLSYAVALCVLMVLECIRPSAPTVSRFYQRYLDISKDQSHTLLISHAALIVGCGLPLWISNSLPVPTQPDGDFEASASRRSVQYLLPLWGVWVLGVGDALAAVVGRTWGRTRWNDVIGSPTATHGRTLEGSLAMLVGLLVVMLISVSCLLPDPLDWRTVAVWLPAVIGTTLLEACTTQIDNLVLPLAGAALLLAFH